MPTVHQIAQHAGVAKSTVSLVLNHKPGVTEQTRQLVYKAYRELCSQEAVDAFKEQWQTADRDASYRNEVSKPLSLVVYHPAILRSSQVFSELLEGIQGGADYHQAQIRLAVNEPNLPVDHISNLYLTNPALRPQGILIIGAVSEDPVLHEAWRLGIPCVLVSRQTDDPMISAVGQNERGIAKQAVEYLLELGHKAIGFVGGDARYSYTIQRSEGYRQALAERGITPLERWVIFGDGDQAAGELLQKSPEVTAIVFVNDSYAMEGLPVIQSAGYAIPHQMSVVSFDDTVEAQSYQPPLTSVHNPRYEVGAWAVRILVEMIRNPLMDHLHVILKPKLLVRDSCTFPRSS